MKTPRDLLLERHRRQSPALDQLRQSVIAQELGADTTAAPQGRTGLQPVSERTEEVAHVRAQAAQLALTSSSIEVGAGASGIPSTIGPSSAPAGDRLQTGPTLRARWFAWLNWQRAAWSGFAAVWSVILGLNLAARLEGEHHLASGSRAEAREVLMGMHEYQKQLAALLTDSPSRTVPGARVKPSATRPRNDADRIRKDALHIHTTFA